MSPGFLLGSLGLGWLADRIGRKRNLLLTLAGLLLSNLVSAATPHFSVYLGSRLLVGVFLAGNILSAVTLLNELVGPSYRGVYCLALMGSFSIGDFYNVHHDIAQSPIMSILRHHDPVLGGLLLAALLARSVLLRHSSGPPVPPASEVAGGESQVGSRRY